MALEKTPSSSYPFKPSLVSVGNSCHSLYIIFFFHLIQTKKKYRSPSLLIHFYLAISLFQEARGRLPSVFSQFPSLLDMCLYLIIGRSLLYIFSFCLLLAYFLLTFCLLFACFWLVFGLFLSPSLSGLGCRYPMALNQLSISQFYFSYTFTLA